MTFPFRFHINLPNCPGIDVSVIHVTLARCHQLPRNQWLSKDVLFLVWQKLSGGGAVWCSFILNPGAEIETNGGKWLEYINQLI